MSLKQEIEKMQQNYIGSSGNKSMSDVIHHNCNVAKRLNKQEVAFYWNALQLLVKDLSMIMQEIENEQNFNLVIENVSPTTSPKIDLHKKPSKDQKQSKENIEFVEKLYSYFEKYPGAFKAELDAKNILLVDGTLRVKQDRLPYYKKLFENTNSLKSFIDIEAMKRNILVDACHNIIQKVIDNGDLASGFWMFLSVNPLINFDNSTIRQWTLSYIDLLESLNFQSYTVQVAQNCPIQEIKLSNKTTYNQVCSNCNTAIDSDKSVCQKCHSEVECSVCQLPVKGLLVWCQVCQHAGHPKEYKKWFSEHQECPNGCGHKCFSKDQA